VVISEMNWENKSFINELIVSSSQVS